MNQNITQLFDVFSQHKILILGDVMLDKYVFGQVKRVSPEAPIPIVDVYKRDTRLGGAANVAANIKALGAQPLLASVVGDDVEGHTLKRLLQAKNISSNHIILDQDRITTVKTRVVSQNQQLLRHDYEKTHPLDEKTELLLIDNIIDLLYSENPNAVIFQDYNKGVLTPKVIANIIHNCQQLNIPIAVDPKFDNFFDYKGCTLFKPNLKEAIAGLEMYINPAKRQTLVEADLQLRALLNHQYTIVTLGEKGIFIGTEDDHDLSPAYFSRIQDVSGAGDTVISVFTMGLTLGLDIFATAELANIAAGLVCKQTGVAPINRDVLLKEAAPFFNAEA